MKEKLIIGNQKNYMNISDVNKFLKKIENKINDKKVIICPSNIYIPYYLKNNFRVGIQNIVPDNNKAYTGEITSSQAKRMGIDYILVGHSERRINFLETDKFINEKVKDALTKNLKVVLCIGETLEEKNLLKTTKIIKKQLLSCLKDIEDFKNIIIAYEPIWAIGTNIIPSSNDISKASLYIKKVIKNNFGFENIKVLYGGSVSSKNIKELNEINEVNGFLIGKSSIDADEFLDIIEVVKF